MILSWTLPLALILAIGCSTSRRQETAHPVPRDVDREFEALEQLESFKLYRPIRWKRWRRTIEPRSSYRRKNVRPRRQQPPRPRHKPPSPSRLRLEIDQNIEWYCIKHRKKPHQCRRLTEPILNRCTRQNGNRLDRKVLNCVKKKLKLRR